MATFALDDAAFVQIGKAKHAATVTAVDGDVVTVKRTDNNRTYSFTENAPGIFSIKNQIALKAPFLVKD